MLAIQSAFGGESSSRGPYGLAAMSLAEGLFIAAAFVVPAMVGAIEITCGMKLRKRSIFAAFTAAVVVSMQVIVTLILGYLWYRRAPDVFQGGFVGKAAYVGMLA